jgi:hypothetical protein
MGRRRTRGKDQEQKREEALQRQAERVARTDQEQLDRLDAAGLRAAKERVRLERGK